MKVNCVCVCVCVRVCINALTLKPRTLESRRLVLYVVKETGGCALREYFSLSFYIPSVYGLNWRNIHISDTSVRNT
jgi:hypothetical protein